jgi:hypothetical protein
MNVFYSDSKTDLKLGRDSSIKFHLFESAEDVVTRLAAVRRMLLPHNPYRLPQHYKRHVCGSYCSCKHRFVWISPIFEYRFCLNYMGTVRHWPFCSSTRVRLIGQCWYFNSQWTPEQPIKLYKDTKVFHCKSKTDQKLLCDCLRMKFPVFESALDRLTAVCCILLPHNPYRLP